MYLSINMVRTKGNQNFHQQNAIFIQIIEDFCILITMSTVKMQLVFEISHVAYEYFNR